MEMKWSIDRYLDLPSLSAFSQMVSLSLLLLLTVVEGNGQGEISSTELLTTHLATQKNTPHEALLFLQTTNQKLPLVEKLEFRTETDEFDLERQEYLFRVSLNGTKAQKAQTQITQSSMRLYQTEVATQVQKKLKEQYQFIIDWYYLEREQDLFENRREILEDKRKTYEKMMSNNAMFSIDDFLKNDQNIQKIDRATALATTKKDWIFINLSIAADTLKELGLNQEGWITVEKMKALQDQLEVDLLQNPKYAEQAAQVDFAKSQLDFEVARGKKVIDFLQMKYRGDDKLEFGQEWSVGLGVNIPTNLSVRRKQNEAILEILEEERQMRLLQENIFSKIQENQFLFKTYYQEYELLKTQSENRSVEESLSQHLDNPNVNIITLLKVKENQLKTIEDLLEIEKILTLLYLDNLDLSGNLEQAPLINHLTEALQPIPN